ncbi:hypothetical protein SOCEGT47_059320 [Sorangium cellulosum]|uniref:Fucose-binding lectin protein n=1 Tax=Sorangium cellulosum TaxID=56 RepID=A0A4P2Q798_SORCE|nr:fucose-binding lectin protein [Sorangium cellulosum]AUX25387.1 hypothetical protein SOCEGT47_059320 [Sorangium cellulosum]
MSSNRLSQSASATSWFDGKPHIRVYTLSGDGNVKESCWDKDHWYAGALTDQFQANCAPGATSWLDGGQIHLRVYSTTLTDGFQEFCWDKDSWYVGAFKGT